MRRLPKQTEHESQKALFAWAALYQKKYPALEYMFAVPNGAKLPWRRNSKGQRYSPEAMRLLAEGLKPGCPDIFLPVPQGSYHGLFIEMKVGKGKLSPMQKQFCLFLSVNNYKTAVCYGFEQAKEAILEYLLGQK